MGAEQSQTTGRQNRRRQQMTRGSTVPAPVPVGELLHNPAEPSGSGNNSPGTSVCSDSELPYISYTVNRPIGDSPKRYIKPRRQMSEQRKPTRPTSMRPTLGQHNIVVVKHAKSNPDLSCDVDLSALNDIPMFAPIMPEALGLRSGQNILAGLDDRAMCHLVSRYQAHLTACCQPVVQEQTALVARTREIDAEVYRLLGLMVERQRTNAKIAQRLSSVHEMSSQLIRCSTLLNECLDSCHQLNEILPSEDRLTLE